MRPALPKPIPIPFVFWTLFVSIGLAFIDLPFVVEAKQANYTIDDTLGDSHTGMQVQYSPSFGHPNSNTTVWKNQANCTTSGCRILPPCQQHDNSSQCTWSSVAPSNGTLATASFQFNGTAVYIYSILANIHASGIRSDTTCDFFLDGEQVGHYEHVANASGVFQYNSLVYSNTSIPFELHQFSIHVSYPFYAIFDYAVYTTELPDDDPSQNPSLKDDPLDTSSPGPDSRLTPASVLSTSASTSPGANRNKARLIGIILGVLTPLIVLIAGIIFLRHRGYRLQLSFVLLGPFEFNWVKSRASRVFGGGTRPSRSGDEAQDYGESESRNWQRNLNHRELRLTPPPHRRNNRRQRYSKTSLMRPFTPGFDMHCRGDDVSTLGGTATPRSRFDFNIFSSGPDPHHGHDDRSLHIYAQRPLVPIRRPIGFVEGFGGGSGITITEDVYVASDSGDVPRRQDQDSDIKASATDSEVSEEEVAGRIKTMSQSSLTKMHDLHSRPLPPPPAAQSPSSPKSPTSPVRLLPIPSSKASFAVMNHQQPQTPPPGYIP
ncbi:hypothetical protein D9758_008208 [Tetrapyrgos nigripes]|uniref:Uncharacterized protein n=1 Tax=Tetrapyrgos nigripes TaxID=182062 RepID=A0A8H5G1G5_9AGAR|nr:hypothetical protein D9758_008208 [Tetrapyrgos nigripes]